MGVNLSAEHWVGEKSQTSLLLQPSPSPIFLAIIFNPNPWSRSTFRATTDIIRQATSAPPPFSSTSKLLFTSYVDPPSFSSQFQFVSVSCPSLFLDLCF